MSSITLLPEKKVYDASLLRIG